MTSLAVGIAGVSWADAPDPAPGTAVGRVVANPAGAPAGAVTIEVEGNWAWPTHRSDCNTNRWGVGWAVDWNDPLVPGPVTLTGKDKNGNPISADPGGPGNDRFTHYNGGSSPYAPGGPRCGTYNAALGYNTGHWGPIRHTYAAPPATLNACVVTYDLHDGGVNHPETGEPGIKQDDTLTSAGDNSIEKNGSTPGGNQCADIVIDHPLSLTVDKTNDANGNGTYNKTETAPTAGANVPFKVTINNTSDYAVKVRTLTDKVGGVDVPNALPCVVAGGGSVIGTTIAAKGSTTCTFTATGYSPPAGDDKTNTVDVVVEEATNPNNTKPGSSTSTVHTLDAAPDLSIKKTGPANGVAGGNGTYELTVTNNGNATAPSPLVVTDTLPVGETFVGSSAPCAPNGQIVTCSLPQTLGAGKDVTFTVTVKYADNATGDLTDCATVKNGNVDSAKSCATTNIKPDLAVNIVKTNDADGNGTYSDSEVSTTVGKNVPFQAVITNTSKVPVVINTLTDEWAGHAATSITACGVLNTTLAAGGSVTCKWTEDNYSPADGQSKVNTARVAVNEVNKPANTAQDSDTSTVATNTVKNPNLVILKTGPATAVSGTEVNYNLKVTNNGTAAKVAPITVTDALPLGETFVSATVPCAPNAGPGAQTVTCVINQGLAVGDSLDFTVRVKFADDASGDYKDCAKVDQSAESCVTTNLTPVISLTVVKTNDANQDGTYNGTETAKTIGQAVTFRALITNTSKVAVQLDSISDAIGAGAGAAVCDANKNAVLAANGGNVLCTFTLNNYAPAAGSLVDTVTATGHEAADATNKVSASGQSTVIAPSGAPALTVLKTGPATTVAASQVDYTIQVTNNGTATANGPITVTDSLPAGETFLQSSNTTCAATAGPGQTVTCTIGTLAVGASTSFTVRVQFGNVSGNFTDCARVGDSQSCVTTTVQKPDLSIVKTGPTTIKPGQDMTYTLTVKNIGPIPTSNFVVTDTLPAGLTLKTVNQGAFVCASGGAINCTHPGVLAPGNSVVITFTATLASIYTAPSVINTAVVNPTDDTPDNNTSTWITPVEQPGLAKPDLSIDKKGPAIAEPGKDIVYTLTVTNTGTVDASGFTVTDPLTLDLIFKSAFGSGFTCTGPGVNCTFPGVLAPGGKAFVTVVTTLVPTFEGESVINTATVGPTDDTPGDNTSTFITPVKQPAVIEPDLGITKTGPASVSPGETYSYTLTVRNTGLVSATGFTVTDELPPALTLVSVSGNGYTCSNDTVSCTYAGTLMPAGTAPVTVTVTLSSSFTGTSVKNVAVVAPTDGTPDDNRAEVTTPVNQPSPPLPFTGSNTYQLLLSSLALLSVGAALVLAGRRRRRLEV